MNLYPIETGSFYLDGGAMFGVVPKNLWNRTNPADSQNRIELAMRCLLIEDGSRLILIDNGVGHKYNEKFAKIFGINHEHSALERSLEAIGFSREDITDVILTHMHFDHAGGSTEWDRSKERYVPVFENAIHWVQKSHLEWALNPNPRERASFFPNNIRPLMESGNLNLLQGDTELFPNIDLKVFDGHTEKQQAPVIQYKGKTIFYAADVIPTYGHIPLPYVMGYDVRPLTTMEERAKLLPWLVENNVILFYEHDPFHECGTVVRNEKGKYESGETFLLREI